MAVYLDFDCDLLADFDSTTITGHGAMGTESTYQAEGAGCIWGDVDLGAGEAYGVKALTTPIADGNYFHIRVSLWFNLDASFPTGDPMALGGWADPLRLAETVSAKLIVLRMLETKVASRHQWEVVCNSASPTARITPIEPGWIRTAWHEAHIYGFVDDSVGWLQMWSGGSMLGEVTGIDTYPGAAWNSIVLGLRGRQETADTDIGFGVDGVLIDDEASPVPPGTVKPTWYYQMLNRRRSA